MMSKISPPIGDVLSALSSVLGEGTPTDRLNGRWKFRCPICGKSNKLFVDLNKTGKFGDAGAFHCFVCNFSGYIPKIFSMFGLHNSHMIDFRVDVKEPPDLEKISEIYTDIFQHGKIEEDHKKWLVSRGLAPNTNDFFSASSVIEYAWNKYSTKRLFESGLANRDGSISSLLSGNRICFPYKNPRDSNLINYIRSRDIDKSRSYLSPKGVPQKGVLYGTESIEETSESIAVTEGEIKARACIQYGIKMIGIPGINSNHQEVVDFILARKTKRVYILFDSEDNKYIDLAITSLSKKIYSSIDPVCVLKVSLPLLGRDKMDTDSFLLMRGPSRGIEELSKMFEAAEIIR
jgi:hypothetical protein